MEERRKFIRRQADRDLLARYQALLQRVQQLEALCNQVENKELRHKRRRTIRHTCHVRIGMPIGFQSDKDDVWHVDYLPIKGKLLDLSHDGCAIFSHQCFDIGQRIHIVIEVPENQLIRVLGNIRWTKNIPEKGGYASGVQFVRINPSDVKVLNQFLEKLDQTIGL